MYTPITKRVKVAQHKSSIAKQKDDKKKVTETATTQNEQGYETETKGTGTPGSKKTITCDQKVKEGAFATKEDCLKAVKDTYGTVNPTKEGLADNTITTDPEASFKSTPKTQDAEAASRIDLYSSPEGRASFRTGQSQGRFARKTSRQSAKAQDKLAKFLEKNKDVVPEPGDKGYRKYQKLLTASETFKSQKEGAENRLKNYRQMTDGMRNRYLSQTMDYDRDLTKGKDAGPVKAPVGTQTEEEFRSNFREGLGINGGSSNPQTTTTPTSSFSEMAATSNKPITLSTGALFEGLDSSISAFANKVKKGGVGKMTNKPGAFKMKGYGSRK